MKMPCFIVMSFQSRTTKLLNQLTLKTFMFVIPTEF